MKINFLLLMVYFLLWNKENGIHNTESTVPESQNTAQTFIHSNKRRRVCAPINLYANHYITFRLEISGDIESNPGLTMRTTCTTCKKTVRKNSYRLECKVCLNLTHVKCIQKKVNKNSPKLTAWTCHNCLFTELPFINADINDPTSPPETPQSVIAPPAQVPPINHAEIINSKRNHFSICHLNVQNIKTSFAEFQTMLYSNKFDIITLSETWLKENPGIIERIQIPGYKFKNNDRTEQRGGGVGAYVSEKYTCDHRRDIDIKDTTIEHMWLEVKGKTNPFLVAVFYQPSSVEADKRDWIQKFDALLSYVFTIWSGPIVITGDTNIDFLKKECITVNSYKNTLEHLGLVQHVTKPTRKGKTLIDHVITNISKIHHEDVLACDEISDHDAAYIICNIRKPRFEPRYKYIRVEKNFNAAEFITEIEQLPLTLVYAFDTPEEKLETFNELFLSCLNRHAPLVKQKMTRPPAPWLKDLNISDKQRMRDILRKKAHETQADADWKLFRDIRNELKKLIRTAKSNFYKKALSSKRPKEVWATIHRILHPNPQKVDADPDLLNRHFNTTANRLLQSCPKPEQVLHEVIGNLPEMERSLTINQVTYSDVRKAILELRNDCSTGHDQIPAKFLKICVNEITSPITHIINSAIDSRLFPNLWKVSKISPIPKTNHPKEPSDYRPISILPILSKVYEKLIMKQMSEFLESEELLSINQSGFRKGYCTVTTCIKFKNDILKAMDRGEITLALLADFSKAFDTVDFEILIKKLHALRFSKSTLYLIANYLSNRRQYVQINENMSPMLTVTNGVPQGSILGPILFNIYVHDMSKQTDAECVQYADDTNVYRHCKPQMLQNCCNQMNNDTNVIQTWSYDTNLIFNSKKTKCMLFRTNQMATRHNLDFNIQSNDGKSIERVASFKLLGITFKEDLSWNDHVKTSLHLRTQH